MIIRKPEDNAKIRFNNCGNCSGSRSNLHPTKSKSNNVKQAKR
ncbi:hypothetical protein J2Z29_000358 [Treponema pedis]